ncbi:hypothetical protein AWZ03_009079 [Drosophila navojoa]|uniref:C2H2-type domain-containing protein n=1 Tax=Drosophila navojoa TaxID=7232 RepID=A0A484B9K0_DRONA|nr:zinc finger protein 708-like [Drosophila navojoa]TDG44501.1 hypothetical protein AWZ03_009079 [Drosophila navojoa]
MDANKSFKCNEPGCGKAFWYKAALKRHLNTHKENDPDAPIVSWGCNNCTKMFTTVESLRRHFRTAHGSVYVYPCQYEGCNQMFQRKDNLTRHAASHADNKHCCDICGKSFARKDALTRHKVIHTRKAQAAETTSKQSQTRLNPVLAKHRSVGSSM